MDIDKLKNAVIGEIDSRYPELGALSKKLHDNPEIAFEEKQSSAWLAEFLEQNDFKVEKGICKLSTAFRGQYGKGKPVIAFLAEYDALPKIGHACGHNLIATGSVAAAVASQKVVDVLGGTIVVFGTPGEEILGGKAIMAERDAFTDIDMAMISHPGGGNTVVMNTLACETLDVEFIGKSAHAAAEPETGINAQRLRLGNLREGEWPLFVEATGRLSDLPLFIDDTPSISVLQMRTKARRLHAEHGIDLILADYLHHDGWVRHHSMEDSQIQNSSCFGFLRIALHHSSSLFPLVHPP